MFATCRTIEYNRMYTIELTVFDVIIIDVVIVVVVVSVCCSWKAVDGTWLLPVITPHHHVATMQRISMKRRNTVRIITRVVVVVVGFVASSVQRNWPASHLLPRPAYSGRSSSIGESVFIRRQSAHAAEAHVHSFVDSLMQKLLRIPQQSSHVYTGNNSANRLRLQNDLYCIGWVVKLYSLLS